MCSSTQYCVRGYLRLQKVRELAVLDIHVSKCSRISEIGAYVKLTLPGNVREFYGFAKFANFSTYTLFIICLSS